MEYKRVTKILFVSLLILSLFHKIQSSNSTINIIYISDRLQNLNPIQDAISYAEKSINFGLKTINISNETSIIDSVCSMYLSRKPAPLIFTRDMKLLSELEYNLPMVTVDYTKYNKGDSDVLRSTDEMNQNLVKASAPSTMLPGLIQEIVTNIRLDNIGIICDSSLLDKIPLQSKDFLNSTRYAVIELLDFQKKIKYLRNELLLNFIVVGSIANIKMELSNISCEYFNNYFMWIFITLDISINNNQLKTCNSSYTSFLIKPVLQKNFPFLMDKNLNYILEFILISGSISRIDGLIRQNKWPGFTCNNETISITSDVSLVSLMKELNLPDDKSILKVNSTTDEFEIKFNFTLMRISNGINQSFNTTILPMTEVGLQNLEKDKPNKFYRVVAFLREPFVYKDKDSGELIGLCIDLLNILSAALHFNYTITTEDRIGLINEDGTWDGIIKKIIDKEADIGIGPISVMAEREAVIDFTVPYYDLVGITILMHVKLTPSNAFRFLTVLQFDVWLYISGTFIVTSLLMWFSDKWSPYSYRNNMERYKDATETRIFGFKESLWFCLSTFTPQGGGEIPKSMSSKLIAATWWLFGFIILSSYTANLAAFFTIPHLDEPIENLDDLANQYRVQYAPIYNSEEMVFFQRMANIEKKFYNVWKEMSLNDSLTSFERSQFTVWDYPVGNKYTKLWDAMQKTGFPANETEALKRIRNSTKSNEFAFLGDAMLIKYLNKTKCDLQLIGEEFSRKPYAIALRQGSLLKEQFDTEIVSLMAKGEIKRMDNEWWKNVAEETNCTNYKTKFDGLEIGDIGGIFLLILIGIVLACFILIYEYYWYKRNRVKMLVRTKISLEPSNEIFTAHNVSPCEDLSCRESQADYARWHQAMAKIKQRNQNLRISLRSTKSASSYKFRIKRNLEQSQSQQ